MKVIKIDGTEVEVVPDVFVVIEIGRQIQVPEYVTPAVRVSAARAVTVVEFGQLARQVSGLINRQQGLIGIIPSGPIAINVLWALWLGTHRPLVIGQWNGTDYDWVFVDPAELRNFFCVEEANP